MEKFAGTLAVVTGASAGIGHGLVLELLKSKDLKVSQKIKQLWFRVRRQVDFRTFNFDSKVIGLARREIDIRHENFVSFKCDVGNAEQVKAAFENIRKQFPDIPISILVNNAGHAKVRYKL